MSFGKVAHDLVMRMQKIDGENYPEVLKLLKSWTFEYDFVSFEVLFI